MTLRLLIVDDSPRFLQAARGLLERQGLSVVGVAAHGAAALQQAEALRPDLTLVDIDLERRPSSHAACWLPGGWRAMTWRLWTTAARRKSKRFLRGPR